MNIKNSLFVFCLIIFFYSCLSHKMRSNSNTNINCKLYDPWNLPQATTKALSFSLNIANEWIVKSYEDLDSNAYGYFYKPFGDTIQYKLIKGEINLSAIKKSSNMSYYEELYLQGHRAKIFKEDLNWYGYYIHSDSIFNAIKVPNVKDEVLVKYLLRNYKYL